MGLRQSAENNPILFGCIGVMGLGAMMACGAVLLVVLGGKGCLNKLNEASGLDSLIDTVSDAGTAGFSFGVNVTPEQGTVFDMTPLEPRQVSCDDLGAVVAPHLTGTLETVLITSQSIHLNEDGSTTSHPLRCSWSDYPGSKPGEVAPTPSSQGAP